MVVSQVQTDLSLLVELVDDFCFEVGAVDTGLPEGSSIAVLLPVVMPVPLLVGTITEHRHLNTDRKWRRDTLRHNISQYSDKNNQTLIKMNNVNLVVVSLLTCNKVM